MNRILSWKIGNGIYAYIYPPYSGTSTRIGKKLTENDDRWSAIIENSKNEGDYESNYRELITELKTKFNIDLGEDYKKFYDFQGEFGTENIVLLVGADGEGNGSSIGGGTNENIDYKKLEEYINQELSNARTELEEQNIKIQNRIETSVTETLNETQNKINKATEELNLVSEDLKSKLEGVEGTVAEAKQIVDENKGYIESFVSEFDSVKNTVSEVKNFISASGALISDTINYISGDGLTTIIKREIDGANAQLIDEITTQYSGVTTVFNDTVNALSGTIVSELNRYDEFSDVLTSIGENINAVSGSMETWMTQTNMSIESLVENNNNLSNEIVGLNDSIDATVTDLREEWSFTEGKLSSVSDLIGGTDENGNYVFYAKRGEEEVIVTKDENGKWKDEYGNVYETKDLYIKYSPIITSYIQQTSSSITMSVINDSGLTAGIAMKLSGDTSFINLVADQVNIDAEVIANALSANSANIGGISIGKGSITSTNFNIDSNGNLSATNATIKGNITADEGKIGGFTINDGVLTCEENNKGETNLILDGKEGLIIANKGYIGGFKITDSAFTSSDADELLKLDGISGTLYARNGVIGGFEISGDTLNVNESGTTVAYLKGVNNNDSIITAGLNNKISVYFFRNSSDFNDQVCVKKDVIDMEISIDKKVDTYIYNDALKILQKLTNEYTLKKDSNGDLYLINAGNLIYKIVDQLIDVDIINTRLYADGRLFTNSIYANEGEFNGVINSKGIFYGELDNVKGTLNNAVLTNSQFNGDIELLDDNTLICKKNYETYFSVGKTVNDEYIENNILVLEKQLYYDNSYNSVKYQQRKVNLINTKISNTDIIEVPDFKVICRVTLPYGIDEDFTYKFKVEYVFNQGSDYTYLKTETKQKVVSKTQNYTDFELIINIPSSSYTYTNEMMSGNFGINLYYDLYLPSKAYNADTLKQNSFVNIWTDSIYLKHKIKNSLSQKGTIIDDKSFKVISPNGENSLIIDDSGITLSNNNKKIVLKDGKVEIINDSYVISMNDDTIELSSKMNISGGGYINTGGLVLSGSTPYRRNYIGTLSEIPTINTVKSLINEALGN